MDHVKPKQLTIDGQVDEDLHETVQEKASLLDEGKGKTISSEVFDSHIHLINQLGDSELSGMSELASLFERLTTLWDDSTCLDISQCMLNKSILLVAAKFVEADISGCLGQFLSFGSKASEWCGKHLKVMLVSIEDYQEENVSSFYFQLVLNLLSFSAASFSALTRSPIVEQKVLMLVEKFIFECLSLTKVSVSEIKRIHSIASSEVLKVAQLVLDASVRVCRAYSQAVNLELSRGMITEDEESFMDKEKVDNVNHVIDLIKCTIDHLCELGILAAGGGGSLVMILNVSWKGVVTLLQLGKGVLARKINVADIMLNLISLATESLRRASESWSSSKLKEEYIGSTEAKRIFLPVKFYLITAVRISSQYPCEAVKVYREIALCVLMISDFSISLSKETRLRASSEALAEFLEPASILLLQTLLNSAEVKQESMLQILDWLFPNEGPSSSLHPKEINTNVRTLMDEIFTVTCEAIPKTTMLMLGRVALFLNLLKNSAGLGEDIRLEISRKLGWLFDSLIDEDAYSSILALHIPVLHGSGTMPQLTWQPMFSFILHALKAFMIVGSSSLDCGEVESFLLENFLHPHFLLSEIIMELWCFVVRHAEIEMVSEIIDKLCSLFKFMASSELGLMHGSALRRMARSICVILTHAPDGMIDRVYSIIDDDRSPLPSVVYITLLIEGFPLHLLSNDRKKLVIQRIVTAYVGYMENNEKNLLVDNLSRSSSSCLLGEPVYALSCALRCLSQISSSADVVDVKTLNFAIYVIHGYRNATDNLKEHYCELLSQTVGVISNMKHLFVCDEMEKVILELHSLFVIGGSAAASSKYNTSCCLYRCKPNLCLLMAGLGNMEIVESEGSKTSTALWELCHMLLREQHWAFAHLAITGFGYFAARTSCNELWRFVPQDAALSFNEETGDEANEERFMCELKAFLEKEVALLVVEPCTEEQLAMLVKEGMMLKETVRRMLVLSSFKPPEEDSEIVMEIDDGENQASKKRRKLLPLQDEIGEGMSLLQRGLKVMGNGLALWRQHTSSMEWQEEFLIHFSHLEDVIASLAGLAAQQL